MKKYEAPIAELEIFAVENVMDGYTTECTTDNQEPAPCDNDYVCNFDLEFQ